MSDTNKKIRVAVEVDASGAKKGLDDLKSVTRKATAEIVKSGQESGKAIDGIGKGSADASANVDRSTKSIINSIQRTTVQMEAGGKVGSKYYEILANQRGVPTSSIQSYLDALKKVEESQKTAAVSAAQTAAAMRQLPAQFTDIITSLQGGQKPLTVLLQQGGQIKDSFGGAGNAAKALAGYIAGLANPYTVAAVAAAGLAYAYNEGAKEATAYNKAIIMTGNQAGTTAQQLADMASSISRATGDTKGLAAETLTALVSTGKVSADNLQKFSNVAVDAQRTMGVSIADTVAQFAELGKSPLQTLGKLSEQYGFVTGEVYKTVMALEQQGKKSEAANIAQNAYADAIAKQRYAVLDSLTDWERGWERIKKMTMGAIDAALNVGREKGNMEKINDLLAQRESLERRIKDAAASGDTAKVNNLKERLVDNEKEINQIRSKEKATTDAAKAQANENEKNQNYVKWLEEGNQYLTKRQQMEKEIAAARNTAKAAGLQVKVNGAGTDGPEITDRLAAISRKYADLNNSNIASLEAARRVEKEILAGSLADIESHHKQALISDADYVIGKRDLQLKDLDQEKALVQKQAAIAAGKADLSERQRYLGELQVIEEKRKAIIKNAQNALSEYALVSTRYVDEQLSKWKNATLAEQDLLVEELQLFGKSSEARKIQSAQLKIDAEVRESLAKAKADHIALMPDEIAKIQLEAMTRKANIAAIMGERQALEGANQLREENLKFSTEYIIDEKERAKAILAIDADKWRERIQLAGDGTEAQKRLQTEFDTWYANQSIKPQLEAQKEMWKSIDSAAHDAFINIGEGGKKVFDRLKDSLKSGLLDLLYQMTVKKWIINIGASITGSMMSSAASAATGDGGSIFGSASTLFSVGRAIYNGFSSGFSSITAGYENFATSGFGQYIGLGNAATMDMEAFSAALANGATAQEAQLIATQAGTQSLTVFGQALGTASSYLAGLSAGVYGGRAISGGYSIGDHGNAIVNVGTIAGALIGGPVGAAIGGMIGGLANRTFGMGEKQINGSNVTGTLGTDNLFRNVNWSQQGGWLRSDRSGTWSYGLKDSVAVADGVGYTDTASLASDKALLKALTDSYTALKTSTADYAKALGLNADSIAGRTDEIAFAIGKTAEETQANIVKMFTDVGNKIAADLIGPFSALTLAGEDASTTLTRLFNETKTVDKAIADLKLKFSTTGVDATTKLPYDLPNVELVTAKDRLIQLTGGLDKFSTATSYFAQNFFTEAEKMQPVIDSVAKAMGDLGLSSIKTSDAFKTYIQGLDLSTESGAKLYAQLIAIAPQFKAVADYTGGLEEALKNTNKSIQDKIDELLKSSMTLEQQRALETAGVDASTKALYDRLYALQDEQRISSQRADLENQLLQLTGSSAEIRQRELQQIDPANRALKEHIWALQDEAAAADKAAASAKAIADQNYSLQTRWLTLIGDSEELRRRELEQIDPANRALQQKIWAEEDRQEAEKKAIQAAQEMASAAQAAASAAQQIVAAWQSVSDSIYAEVQRIRALMNNGSASSSSLRAQFAVSTAQARAGDQDAAKLLPTLSQNLLTILTSQASSQLEINRERARIAASLTETMRIISETKGTKLPAFAGGGDHAGGIALVGERGPEIINTGAARIFNAGQTKSILGGNDELVAALLSEVQTLNQKVESMRINFSDTEKNTRKLKDDFQQVTRGGRAMKIEAI